jgi:hypothetical protein
LQEFSIYGSSGVILSTVREEICTDTIMKDKDFNKVSLSSSSFSIVALSN